MLRRARTAEESAPDPLLGYESDDGDWWVVQEEDPATNADDAVTEWLRIERDHAVPFELIP